MTVASSLAQTNALAGETDESGAVAMDSSRPEMINLLHHILANNPKLLDAYIGWEPNAFGEDANFVNQKGHNAVGRFIPWWYRDASGKLVMDVLGDTLESVKPLPTGVREGEYYLCPRDTKRPCVIDPAPYDMGGKMVMLASFNAPILVKGQFRGIAGADLSLDFIQQLLTSANQKLYGGVGEMALLSSNKRLVATQPTPASSASRRTGCWAAPWRTTCAPSRATSPPTRSIATAAASCCWCRSRWPIPMPPGTSA